MSDSVVNQQLTTAADLHGPDVLAELRAENERLERALASSNEQNARIQAEGNALANRIHEQATRLQAWREACRQYGIPEDPEGLRAALRHLVASVCAGECEGRCGR